MPSTHNRRLVAAVVAVACLAIAAPAAADTLPATYKSDAAQSGQPPASDRTDAAQSGWDGLPVVLGNPAFPLADFRGGDSPVDHPGASRSTAAAPTTVEVVRPERTIVRDVDEVLPLILSSTALVLVLAGLGIALVRGRLLPGRSH